MAVLLLVLPRYTGKALFEAQGGRIPYGLILGANGGTAIEVFMPLSYVQACMVPQDCHQNVSQFGHLCVDCLSMNAIVLLHPVDWPSFRFVYSRAIDAVYVTQLTVTIVCV